MLIISSFDKNKMSQFLKTHLEKAWYSFKKTSLFFTLRKVINLLTQRRVGILDQYSARPLVIPNHYRTVSKKTQQGILPTISIVTPSYNQGRFIKRTIESILEQQYSNLEYVIQDGASNDNTLEILESFREKLAHIESRHDQGQANAINIGFQKTNGEIMAYLNSDDILLPGALHYVGNYFAQHPDVDVIYGNRIIINEDEEDIGRWVLPPHDDKMLLWSDFIPQETLFWRRTLWNKAGGSIDESYQFAMDWELLLRFRSVNANFNHIPRFLAAFRLHNFQKTSLQINTVGFEEMSRLRVQLHKRDVSLQEIRRNISPYVIRSMLYHRLHDIQALFH